MSADTKVKLDEVTVWVHVWLDKFGWHWAVTRTPELPRWPVDGMVLDGEPIKGRCEDSGCVYMRSGLARLLAVRQGKRAAREVAARLAGRGHDASQPQRFTYTATWGVDGEQQDRP